MIKVCNFAAENKSIFHKKGYKKMKKLVYALTMVAAIACMATSCEKENNEPKDTTKTDSIPVDSTVTPTEAIEFAEGYVSFYGTQYSETNNHLLVLYTDMTTDDEGYFNSKGSALQLDLYTTDEELVAGKYTLSNDETYPAGTFSAEYSAWVDIDDAGEQTYYGIQAGTVNIALADDIYTIDINLTDSLGNERVAHYEGALEIYDERENPYDYEPTTPTTITIDAPADSIEAANYGDYYGDGVDNLALYIWDDNAAVELSLYVANGVTALPVGEYKFADDYSEMSLEAGQLYWGMFPVGSYAATEEAYYWLNDGTLTVSETDGVYTIEGTLKSYYGSEISVNYTGAVTLEVYDDADEAPAAKTKALRHTQNAKRIIKAHK